MRYRLSPALVAGLCVLGFGAARAEAQAPINGEFNILWFNPDPDITLQSGSLTGATGITNIDFVDVFGIEKKGFPEIRFFAGRSHKFRFGYIPIKYEAATTINRTITFQGRTFTVGVPATTEIKENILKVGYEWDFVSREKGFFGVVGELKYAPLAASITAAALAPPAATEQNAPVPTIGVAGRGYPHPMVSISGEFTGLKVNSSDFEASLWDWDVNGAVTFGKYIGVQGGYRSFTIDFTIDDDIGNIKVMGPYVGAVVRF